MPAQPDVACRVLEQTGEQGLNKEPKRVQQAIGKAARGNARPPWTPATHQACALAVLRGTVGAYRMPVYRASQTRQE
jgi:hypothetical protein